MCTFITYILPLSADEEHVAAAISPRQYRLKPCPPAQFSSVVAPGEKAWMRSNSCDCGTAIGPDDDEPFDDPLAEAEKRYRRKGWSEGKIRRALENMISHQRATADEGNPIVSIILYLLADPGVPHLKLFYHNYSQSINDETYPISYGPIISHALKTDPAILEAALKNLSENTVLTLKK